MGQEREVFNKFFSLLDPQLWKCLGLLEAWMGKILLQECLSIFSGKRDKDFNAGPGTKLKMGALV